MGKGSKRRICQISNTHYQDNWDLAFVERKDIPTFPGYEITKDGRVWSNKTNKWLSPYKDKGYYRVTLYNNGNYRGQYIHYLLLITFIGPRPKRKEGCHKNDIPTDNNPKNLYWGTRSENRKDTFRNKKQSFRGEKNNAVKLNNLQVRVIKYLLKFSKEFTYKYIAKIFNVHSSTIYKIKKGKTWKHMTEK